MKGFEVVNVLHGVTIARFPDAVEIQTNPGSDVIAFMDRDRIIGVVLMMPGFVARPIE